jgi:thioredoxin/glutathione reductase (selenoprotein)
LYPNRFKADICEFDNEQSMKKWVASDLLPLFKGAVSRIDEPVVTWVDDSKYIGGSQAGLAFARAQMGAPQTAPASSASKAQPDPDTVGAVYDYDVVVIGGGSGGLAFSKRAARAGANVALLDFVKPSPHGTKWGLGGTCVNVGCIPKKLMHTASLIGESFEAAKAYGFGSDDFDAWPKHEWTRMVGGVQDHIKSLNFGYRTQMREEKVKYLNKLGSFVDQHTLETLDSKGVKEKITARRFLIAVGGRPKPLGCPGQELAISSDDLFSLPTAPGKTLVVGASYVALECAGFLHGLGMEVAVMVRSILLRGFDRDMSDRAGHYMEKKGVRFIREAQPIKLEKTDEGKVRVFWSPTQSEDFDTVIAAVGRDPDTKHLGLDKAGVIVDAKSGKIPTVDEQTNVPNIYALGDVLLGKPELTPVAIQAGKLLADRLYKDQTETVDYDNVCTTVFTPLEYSCVGWTEERAREELGDDGLEVFHTNFIPLEWTVSHGDPNDCYLKVLVDLSNDRIVGLHYLGPNAGEVILGYGVAFRKGMTFHDLTSTIGIHPTTTEEFTLVNVTKRSGISPEKTGC